MTIAHVTKGSVLDDLGLSHAEASHLKIRADLMNIIEKHIKKSQKTQVEMAKYLGISQPRVSDLVHGKINKFTIDMLVKIITMFDSDVTFLVTEKMAA